MTHRDLHQPRTFLFHPGETVTLKITKKSKNSTLTLRAPRGQHPVKASAKSLVFRMPKEGLGISTAELEVTFAGRWNSLHLAGGGVEVSLHGSKGVTYKQRILPGPKHGRWGYRIVSAAPGSTLQFCPEPGCASHMVPTHTTSGKGCTCCGGSRLMSVKIRARR